MVRCLDAEAVFVVAFASLIVITYNPKATGSIKQPVFQIMRRWGHRHRHVPDNNLQNRPVIKLATVTDDKRGFHLWHFRP